MDQEFTFSRIQLDDAPALQELAIKNGGNRNLNEKNLNHWYFKNPVKSNSLWKVEKDSVIEGYATTNNFIYTINNEEKLVALPQNVLTSKNIRGKGLFGKLYYMTEIENIEKNGVDFFLTSTGQMSTPIFLKKFEYLRGFCPLILIKIASLPSLFARKKYALIKDINSIPSIGNSNLNYSRKKNIEYFKWRYSECEKKNLKIISVSDNNKLIGYAFLITKKKFGIKTIVLADIICEKEENYSAIIDACHVFATKGFFAAIIMFELSCNCRRRGINFGIKNKFNILVKGKNKEETTKLSQINFNFFFGDFDFFW
jgi:hypothetical protein